MLVVALFAAAAAWFAVAGPAAADRLGSPPAAVAARARARRTPAAFGLAGAIAAVLVLGLGAWAGVALIAGGALVAAIVGKLARDARRRAQRSRRRRVVLEFCDALSAELRAGLPVAAAVEMACSGAAELAPLARAVWYGGELGPVLRACAETPGLDGLRAVAAAWQVAAESGAGLATVVDRIASGLRADDEARAELEAALAPPRATAKMLALLPGFGVLLGVSMGARPVAFLLGTAAGLGCLTVGLGLALTGVLWVERITAAAEA